jgi:hypothetical protein
MISFKLGVDFKPHRHQGLFAATAKSAWKRASSIALRGGETAVWWLASHFDGWRSLQNGQESRAFFSGVVDEHVDITVFCYGDHS